MTKAGNEMFPQTDIPAPPPAEIRALSPAPQDSEWAKTFWPARFEAKKKEIAEKGGSKVVFIGDSITHNWENNGITQWKNYFEKAPYNAIQLGYSGDRTEHVLWRIDHGELDGYEAKAIVLMIGTNNTGHFPFREEPPIDTILGIKAILERIAIHQPKARVILHPIFPRGAGINDQGRIRNSIVNREIMKFADGQRVIWCDFSNLFLLPDGTLPKEIAPDLLHPGPMGYQIWANALMPVLDRVLAAKEGEPVPSVFAAYQDPAVVSRECNNALIPQTRIEPGKRFEPGWWFDRIAAHRRQIAASGGKIDLVFLGDSITHYWDIGEGLDNSTDILELQKKFTVLNCGYGGDKVENLLWRIRNGELDGYTAKLMMLLIGTNNSGAGYDEVSTFQGIKEAVRVIHEKQPEAKILLLALFPRGTADSPANRLNLEVSKLIKGEKWEDYVIVKDISHLFSDSEGNTVPALFDNERLHLSAEGFRIWREAVEPVFDEICSPRE